MAKHRQAKLNQDATKGNSTKIVKKDTVVSILAVRRNEETNKYEALVRVGEFGHPFVVPYNFLQMI